MAGVLWLCNIVTQMLDTACGAVVRILLYKGTGCYFWVSCHDNCAAGECPGWVFLQRAEGH